ncbi:hypothetical protein DQW50_00625 [Halorubrum sp. 48-1-W]|uniref:hypothetical protein n=1 Tax=Halorubrum sp. 48-1-W TaxID=2249761 RepID=UPI000DCC26A9|nr:hypothetical protein [Halorubrum sp. 48-1-W]RAW46927.1 hypothetical protein DQW50_00625 [Halorubrum sp. 48-1-W]
MAEQPSREDRTVGTAGSGGTGGPTDSDDDLATVDPDDDLATVDPDATVDEELKRRLRQAYLNDEEDALVVTGVRLEVDEVVVETRPPHGETTHLERFDAPQHGSLEECTSFLAFLEAAGVSPLDLDDLVGARVPAAFDPETGWRIARRADRPGAGGAPGGGVDLDDEVGADLGVGGSDTGPSGRRPVRSTWVATVEWLREYGAWVIAVLLVGGELLFIALIVVLFA